MASGPSLRERRKQETRERIRGAARRLMAEGGYEQVTMRALAEAAGVGLGTIALHFKDKKTLLLSTFHDEIAREFLQAFSSVPEGGTLKEKFMVLVDRLYGYYERHAIFLRPVCREALFATGEWRDRFDGQLAELLDLVAELLDRHKELGDVRPDVSSHHVAMVCWSIYMNVLVDGLNAETFDAAAQRAKVEPLLDVLLGGVLARGNPPV